MRPWEELMPLQQLDDAMRNTAELVHLDTQAARAVIAARAAHDALNGLDGPQDPPTALLDAIEPLLLQARAVGAASVEHELAAQAPGRTLEDLEQTAWTLAKLPDDWIGKRAWLIGKAIVQAITGAAQSKALDTTDTAAVQTAAEQAGDQAAQLQGRAHAGGALNQGRQDAAEGLAHLIRGSRYTSILDRNRCQVCADADDGVLRTLKDPVRVTRRPPNADCRSTLSGRNFCRCMEFFELNDEAPANLARDLDPDARILTFDPDQPRDPDGKFASIPHPSALTFKTNLGGTTGAQLHTDTAGNKYVVKQGAHPRHLLEEDAADRIYRAADVPVPDSFVHATPAGPVKVSRFLEGGQTLNTLTAGKGSVAREQLREAFVLDAVLGNWDVAGTGHDNVMVHDGHAVRIDNGGALRYRAQGTPKQQQSGYPSELWTMREKGPSAGIFSPLEWPEVLAQAQDLLAKRDTLETAAPGAGQREFLARRLDGLQHILDAAAAGLTEDQIRQQVMGDPAAGSIHLAGEFTARLLDAEDAHTYTLAKQPWTPEDHPRDEDGRFIVKLGGKAMELLQEHLAVHGAPRSVQKALKHGKTKEHTAKAPKTGETVTVKSHTIAVAGKDAHDLQQLLAQVQASKAHNKKPGSGAYYAGINAAVADAEKAKQAAAHHNAKDKPKVAKGFGEVTGPRPAKSPAPPVPLTPIVAIKPDVVDDDDLGFQLEPDELVVDPAGGDPVDALKQAGASVKVNGKPTKTIVPAGSIVNGMSLAVGDSFQQAKGGHNLEVLGFQGAAGYVKVKTPTGKSKTVSPYQPVYSVTKADGTSPTAPAAAAPAKITAAQVAAKLETAGVPAPGPFGDLAAGTVFKTKEGKLAVLDPGGGHASTGYVHAKVIDGSGGKVSVPASAKPGLILTPLMVGDVTHLHPTPAAAGVPASPTVSPSAMFGGNQPPTMFDGVPTDDAARKLWQDWQADTASKLTSAEKSALSSYTNGGYNQINAQLRSSEGIGDVNVAQKVARIDSAFQKVTPSKAPTVLSRKVHLAHWKQNAHKGKVIQDNGFLSTSTNGGTWHGDVHLKILAPAGTRGIWVNTSGGSSNPGEKEVMLPRGSQFIVHERVDQGNTTILYVELIV